MKLETNRLLLRVFSEKDAPEVARMCNNEIIHRHTLHIPYPYSEQDALTWIGLHEENREKEKAYEFAITDKKTGVLYGAVGLSNHQSYDNGEMGYWIGEEHWGNGYASEAAEAMLNFAFNEKNYHKVYARCFSINPASGRVLEKSGMKKEGVLKDQMKIGEDYMDLIYYGILKTT